MDSLPQFSLSPSRSLSLIPFINQTLRSSSANLQRHTSLKYIDVAPEEEEDEARYHQGKMVHLQCVRALNCNWALLHSSSSYSDSSFLEHAVAILVMRSRATNSDSKRFSPMKISLLIDTRMSWHVALTFNTCFLSKRFKSPRCFLSNTSAEKERFMECKLPAWAVV